MPFPTQSVLNALWILFVAYWIWSARKVKNTRRTEPAGSRFLKYWLPLLLAALLLEPGRLYAGSVLAARFVPAAGWVVALGTLIGVLIEGRTFGWTSPTIIASALVTVAAWLAFLRIEARHAHPMLPLSLFRNGVFSGSTCVSMASAFVFYGLLFVVSLDYQQAQAYSPLQTGLALLPMTAMVAVGSMGAGRLAQRCGARWSMIAAFGGYAAGAIGLWLTTAGLAYPLAIVPMLAVGLASGFISPLATAPALETIPPHRAGVAAAALNSARQAGAALGVAIFGSLIAATHPFEAGLQAALALVVVVSLAAMLIWWLALKTRA